MTNELLEHKKQTEHERLVMIEWDYLFMVHQGNITEYERIHGKPKYHTIEEITKYLE